MTAYGDKKLIYVEDEPLIAMDTEMMLRDLGFESITICHTYDQAQAQIDSEKFDVAILDVNLNGKPSTPLGEKLATQGCAIIFTTGYASDGVQMASVEAQTVVKPFNLEDLGEALKNAIGRP